MTHRSVATATKSRKTATAADGGKRESSARSPKVGARVNIGRIRTDSSLVDQRHNFLLRKSALCFFTTFFDNLACIQHLLGSQSTDACFLDAKNKRRLFQLFLRSKNEIKIVVTDIFELTFAASLQQKAF